MTGYDYDDAQPIPDSFMAQLRRRLRPSRHVAKARTIHDFAYLEDAAIEPPTWTVDEPRAAECKCVLPIVDEATLDAAAERGHNAMFYGELAASGVERELWRSVVRGVLDGKPSLQQQLIELTDKWDMEAQEACPWSANGPQIYEECAHELRKILGALTIPDTIQEQ
jgi:hypothetical protein